MSMSQRTRLWLMFYLGIMTAIAPLSTDMYLPSLPIMQHDFGISASMAQMTLMMTTGGMALGQIFAGPLSDRYGRKTPMLLGMLFFTLSTAGSIIAEDINTFLFCRFMTGFAGASGIVVSKAVARDVCQGAELTRFFALLMMVNGLAPIASPVIGGQILLFTDWRGIFTTLTAVGTVLLLATLVYKETLPKEKRHQDVLSSFAKFPKLLKNRYFLGHCLVQCFVFGAFFAYLSGSSFVFQNIYKVSPQVYSLIFGGIGAGLLLSGALPARLAGRVPDEKILKFALLTPFLCSLLLLMGFYLEAPLPVILPILFFTIVPLSVMGAASFSLALSRQGKNAGSASALLGFFSMILGAAIMPLVGIAGDHTAIPMSVIMICGYGLGLITYQLMIAPEHKKA